MAFTLIAHISAQYTGFLSGTTTGNINTTGATLIVVSASGFSAGGSTGILADSNVNTWIPLTERHRNDTYQKLWYCLGPTVGAGHNFTITGGAYGSFEVIAIGGATPVLYDQDTGTSGNGASAQPGSLTPANADSVLVCGLAFQNTGATLTGINSSFTITDTEPGGGIIQGSIAYKVQSGAGSAENPTWSFSGGLDWTTSIVIFYASGTSELTVSKADTLSLSDSLAYEAPVPSIVLSDVLSISDSLASTLGMMLNEQLTLGDLLFYGLSLPVEIDGGALTLSDAITTLIGVGLGKSDALTLSDVLKIGADVARQLGDNIFLSDFLIALLQGLPSYSDNFALADATILNLSLELSKADSLSLSDAVILAIANNLQLSESDSLSLSDSVAYKLSGNLDSYIRHYLNDVPR